MIHELDQSLAALLNANLPFRDRISISFAAPDDQFQVTPPGVDLFLYDLRENLELRGNDEYLQKRDDGTATHWQAPVRVDASYLITAWPGGAGHGDTSRDEHELLGHVMRTLLRFRKLPREYLQGSLAQQDLPLPVTSLQPGRLQSVGEFWQALGGKPKAALNLTVTLAIDAHDPEDSRLVLDKEVRIKLGLGALP